MWYSKTCKSLQQKKLPSKLGVQITKVYFGKAKNFKLKKKNSYFWYIGKKYNVQSKFTCVETFQSDYTNPEIQ